MADGIDVLFRKIKDMDKVIKDQYAMQMRIFGYLNSFAKGDHMNQFSRIDNEGVIAQVYGDLAGNFFALEKIAKELEAEGKDNDEIEV